ncbi:MAG TPA: hypothetical protein VGD59_12170 [Acidisarcina sp.]
MKTPMNLFRSSASLIATLLALSASQSSATAQDTPPQQQISVPIRRPAEMEPGDASLVARRTADIARAAAFYGYTLDSSWQYDQAVCSLAPGHVLLSYYKAQVPGDLASSFSAIVPRSGGVVRIVPLVHNGTAPFVIPWGEHSYSVFNSITEGNHGMQQRNLDLTSGDAFEWGLCYVALVGQGSLVSNPDRKLHTFDASEPTVHVASQGGLGLGFTVQDDRLDYSVWQLEFSPKGLLVHADRTQRELRPVELETAAGPGSLPAEGRPNPAMPVPEKSVSNSSPMAPVSREQSSATPTGLDSGSSGAPARSSSPADSLVTPGTPAGQPTAPLATQSTRRRHARARDGEAHPIPDGPAPVAHPIPN